jgi:hypothetical protein
MKTLSRIEMKKVMGGFKIPPGASCVAKCKHKNGTVENYYSIWVPSCTPSGAYTVCPIGDTIENCGCNGGYAGGQDGE